MSGILSAVVFWLCFSGLGFNCLGSSSVESEGRVMLDLPPRFMWGWGPPAWAVGYCGSMSLQTVGLYYGNWVTQDAARGTNGGHAAGNSLLLGGHHEKDTSPSSESHALKMLHFNATSWEDRRQSEQQHALFLKWARAALDADEPVIFGVYMRTLKDVDYDHIVTMVGYDRSGIFFNDLHANVTLRYDVSDFVQSRESCEGGSDPWQYCLPPAVDYGIRVHGNADHDRVLLPARLRVNSWSEPDYSKEDAHHEKPVEVHGTVTVTQLRHGTRYVLLRYDDATSVPDRDFLSSSYTSRVDIVGPATGKVELATRFMSNSTIFFRCVRAPELSDATDLVV